jgi:3-vinyl bacteriochlorophyllide hydratase
VQGLLAPLQFLVFAISLVLVLRYLSTGDGLAVATASVVLKTALLYTIMVTGCIWEKVVFDVWLFAPAFYWEDVFSMAVLALHTAYLLAVWQGWLGPRGQMLLALAAYAAYVINATQFLLKLRAARLQGATEATARPKAAATAGLRSGEGGALT